MKNPQPGYGLVMVANLRSLAQSKHPLGFGTGHVPIGIFRWFRSLGVEVGWGKRFSVPEPLGQPDHRLNGRGRVGEAR